MKKLSKIIESIWSDMQDRSSGDVVKKEDGRIIGQLEDGTKLVMSNDAWADGGELVEFDEGNIYTFDESGDKIYVAVMENPQNRDVYYRYDEDSEDVVNMIECFETDDDLRKSNEFGALKAIMRQNEWDDGDFDDLDVKVGRDYVEITVGQSYEFAVYEDRDKAIDYAIDLEKDLLDSDVFTKYTVERFRNILGDDFFDEKSMETDLKDSMESYYNDLDEADAIEELLRYNVIEDTEDYFGLDEDGDIDHSIPKFDYQYYGDVYAEKYIENIDDIVDEFISNFGYDGIENYIKYDRLAKLIVEADGPESTIASYDGVEREEDFYFNLTKTELVKWNYSESGGLEEAVKKIIDTKDAKELLKIYDKIITMSYGIKSPDGKKFVKSEEITNDFKDTNAYDVMFIEYLSHPESFNAFIDGIMPKDINTVK